MEDSGLKEKNEEMVNDNDTEKIILKKEETDNSEKSMDQRRKELIETIKEKRNYIIYIILMGIIGLGSYIRVQNLRLLKDITTGKYIPLALDPHLFLKYTQYIVEHGSLLVHDPTRFVPLGTSTLQYIFTSSFIANLYKFISIFSNTTLEYIDVIYPVICFAVALVFFFLLVKKMFDWKVGLIATFFLSIIPAFLHRTMAGFSDHEALGIMLMFMAMYFYVLGWQNKSHNWSIGWGALAGIFTGFMGLSWGGWKFLILIISLFVLVEFFFDKIKKKDIYQYSAWIIMLTLTTTTWIPMFSIKTLLSSLTTGIAFLVLLILIIDLIFFKYDLIKIKNKLKNKIPTSIISVTISVILGFTVLGLALGPGAMFSQVEELSNNLLHPLGNDRWQLTVAEQHQPYFKDWVGYFGPSFMKTDSFGGFPLYLILFLAGSVILFNNMVKHNKKRKILTATYTCFILLFILSRYSPQSTFNGVNFISKFVYLGSLISFIILGIYFYFNSFYKNKENYKQILSWDKKYIFILVWFLIMVIAARGAARLIFIFAPITAIMASYGITKIGESILKIKNVAYRYIAIIVVVIVLLSPLSGAFSGVIPHFYKSSLSQGQYSGPAYNQQWQIAGQWARENIPEEAVFGHWWDYGYWVQQGFKKSTVLDGANKITYWNHLMGRHVLCGQNQTEALEFLKVHDTTHYLIVSDEIGKYTAYSSIGADKDYDRYSWITTFRMNPQATQETRNNTVLVYQGGYMLDDDFIWQDRIYPSQQAGVGAVFLPVKEVERIVGNETVRDIELEQPSMALMYNNQRVDVPLECVYMNGQMVTFDQQPGYKGCFRIIPQLDGNGQLENPLGAGLFISEEGMKALWVNLYVFEQNNPNYDTSAFESIYQDGYISNLALVQGRIMGPIKIWEIEYPEDFEVDEELEKRYLGKNEYLPDWFFDVN
jgi:asparagine N-glycosylation enzyme membrane subunit Stt3